MQSMTPFRLLILGCLFALYSLNTPATESDWTHFKHVFIQDGRVIDASNAAITHTEGQGVAMLMAVHYDDRATFERVWDWTQCNLQIRQDKLLAWSWSPKQGVIDSNNASDGDLFIAWALSRAYTKWHNPRYLFASIQISQAIRNNLLRKTTKGTVLLPGALGFEKADGLKLNLSYWVFPAINELAVLDPSPDWEDLKETGVRLLQAAQFGKWHLPPDWLVLNGDKLTPADDARFGYDAVRIPLYLIWGKVATPDLIQPYQSFWGTYQDPSFLPSWVDLNSNITGTYNASTGFHNIAAMTLAFPQLNGVKLDSPDGSRSYYSNMLSLFTRTALEDLQK
jgi:endoglucanase